VLQSQEEEEEMRVFIGVIFALADLSALILGAVLALAGVLAADEGNVEVVLDRIGKITGINGQLVVVLAGAGLALLALRYAYKAWNDAWSRKGVSGAPGERMRPTIKDFILEF
jgi:hypothetical protein